MGSLAKFRRRLNEAKRYVPHTAALLVPSVVCATLESDLANLESSLLGGRTTPHSNRVFRLLELWVKAECRHSEIRDDLTKESLLLATALNERGLRSLSVILSRFGFFSTSAEVQIHLAMRELEKDYPLGNVLDQMRSAILLEDPTALEGILNSRTLQGVERSAKQLFETYLQLWQGEELFRQSGSLVASSNETWAVVGPKFQSKPVLPQKFLGIQNVVQFGRPGHLPDAIAPDLLGNYIFANSSTLAWIRGLDEQTRNRLLSPFKAVIVERGGAAVGNPKRLISTTGAYQELFLTGTPQAAQVITLELLYQGAKVLMTDMDLYTRKVAYATKAIYISEGRQLRKSGSFDDTEFSRCLSLAKHNAVSNWCVLNNLGGSSLSMDSTATYAFQGGRAAYTGKLDDIVGARRI